MKLQKKNAKAQKKQNKTAAGKSVTDTDTFALPNIKSELAFDSAFASFGADIRYIVSAQKIKEDVILNEKGKVYALEMVLENCAYTATLSANGSVIFSDKIGKEYFYIDSPYMYDSQGNGSTDIDVSLKQTGKKVTVTYTPSKAWLDSCERMYPVTFDPAVTTANYTMNMQDTYVRNGVVSEDAELSETLQIGAIDAAYFRIYNLPYTGHLPVIGASFTLSAMSLSSGLVGAKLELYQLQTYVYDSPSEVEIPNSGYLDKKEIGGYTISFDITSIELLEVCARTGSSTLCYGLFFDIESMNYPNETITFASVNNTILSKRPALTLRYGYQNPESLISSDPDDTENRYWITDTSANELARQMLGTGSSSFLTNYTSNSVQGKFTFCANTTGGVVIYACYDACYISAPASPYQGASIRKTNLTNADEWILIRMSDGSYVLALKDYTSLVMTRTDTGVVLQHVQASVAENQKWRIFKTSGEFEDSVDTHPLEEGTYYINSYVTRTFLTDDNGLKLQAGIEANLGNKMAWDLCFVGNGTYMIRKSGKPNTYLSITDGYSLIEITENDPPPSTLFTPISITNNCYAFKNGLNLYLKSGPEGLNPNESVFNGSVWRLCEQSAYNELVEGIFLNDFQMLMGETRNIGWDLALNGYTFTDAQCDFETVITGTANACTASGLVVQSDGTQAGVVKISVTHIPTGTTCECMGWIGDGIFRASYGANSLNATSEESIGVVERIASDAYETKITLGNQLWYTEYYHIEGSEYRYYYIHSLGIADENQSDNNVLTYASSGELSLFLREEGNDCQLRRFEKQSNGTYVIVNKSSNNELRISGSSVIAEETMSLRNGRLRGCMIWTLKRKVGKATSKEPIRANCPYMLELVLRIAYIPIT